MRARLALFAHLFSLPFCVHAVLPRFLLTLAFLNIRVIILVHALAIFAAFSSAFYLFAFLR